MITMDSLGKSSCRKIKTRCYGHVFSLGELCFCATLLASNGLRTTSDPFDWCDGASFASRVEMVCSGFPNFINKEDLEQIGTREHPEPCTIYRNTYNHIVFNHDFPLGQELDESYEVVHRKYQRRVKRLLDNITKSRRVLCVYMEMPKTENGATTDEQIILAAEKLNTAFRKPSIDILYVRHNESMPDGQVIYSHINENIIIAQTYIARRNATDPNAVNKKNLSKVLSFVYRKGKYRALLKRKLIRFPNRGERNYVSILGIKIKLRKKLGSYESNSRNGQSNFDCAVFTIYFIESKTNIIVLISTSV